MRNTSPSRKFVIPVRHLSLLGLLPLLAAAKSYHLPQVKMEVILQTDGHVRVVQERTYAFDGSFSWADMTFKKQGAYNVRLNRLAVLTDSGWQAVHPQDVTDSDRSLYVRWNFSAEDKNETFLLDYTLVGAVRRYMDVADFYWKLIEDRHERIGRLAVRLALPSPSPSLFKVYVHSTARPGRLTFSPTRDTAYIEQAGIPKNTFVEIRALTDPGLYPQTAQLAEKKYEHILREERRNFASASLKRYLLVPLGLALLLVVPALLLLWFYRKHGREPALDYEAIYEREPPRPAPPAVVPLILHQKPEAASLTQPLFQAMVATLLDLARRGALAVQEAKDGPRSKLSFRLTRLELAEKAGEFERRVTDFFFGHVASGRLSFDEEDIKKYSRTHPDAVRDYVEEFLDAGMLWWRRTLNTGFVQRASFLARRNYLRLMLGITVLGGLVLASGLSGIVSIDSTARLVLSLVLAGGCFVVFTLLGNSVLRWTKTAYLEHRRWRNFRKFLCDFSALEQAPVSLLAVWEHFYVYAVALGVAGDFLKHVTKLAELRGANLAVPAWYVGAANAGGASVASLGQTMSGFGAFAANLGSMMSSFSTTSASGGGFSGGGGRAGGGGSSGAG